ncbi:MAG TPA: RecX family transcriptional regulator [Thermoanaerobaculia bacterium]|nr:RecX family transcriptional regulator [Thermoanaerobaculia bacterium]
MRARSRDELRRALELRGFSADAVRRTLDALVADGSLNENAALASFLLGREERFSRSRLKTDLRRRGFPPDAVDAALGARSEDDDRALLESLFRRRDAELSRVPPEKRKKKVFDFLRRRGFSAAQIFDVMGEPEE